MIDLIGILLVVQGAGGLINRLAGGGSPGWFLQLQLVPANLRILASALVLLAGVAVLTAGRARRTRRRQ